MQAARGTTLNKQRWGVGLLAAGLGLTMLAVDQLIKIASVTYLIPGERVPLVGELLSLNLIRNPGAAFGMGSGVTIVFSVFAILATLGCLVALTRITALWHAVALGLLFGGITGNLVDRITQPPAALHGHVIDMFQVPNFAIFNWADICITVAAGLIIVAGVLAEVRERNLQKVAA
ncbi:signal peptidase II [Tessaracoccus sp. ZS01]|nr:signal peptidase II [Tessaracoccus sp. ZS01]OMG59167.1 signal peptidase II [Tessaracoccus sp. ZS01]